MKRSPSHTKPILRVSCLYSFALLALVVLSVSIIKKDTTTEIKTLIKENVKTEYVYVSDNTDTGVTDIYTEYTEEVYTVREYMGKIGIFLSDGTLVQTIEIYTKTLPIADRRLLEEGFEVVGKQRLYSIIEDYSV